MHRPSRIRRILKWTGAGLSLTLICAWGVTLWCHASITLPKNVWVGISDGEVQVAIAIGPNPPLWEPFGPPWDNWVSNAYFEWPGLGLPRYDINNSNAYGPIYEINLPLWLLLLLTAIPTAWLWHCDRRRIRPGHCPRCGYDLTGNTSGGCSECGERIESATTATKRVSAEES